MDKIPNGGFPPLQINTHTSIKSNKKRLMATIYKPPINIRDILVNKLKVNLFEKKEDNSLNVIKQL